MWIILSLGTFRIILEITSYVVGNEYLYNFSSNFEENSNILEGFIVDLKICILILMRA